MSAFQSVWDNSYTYRECAEAGQITLPIGTRQIKSVYRGGQLLHPGDWARSGNNLTGDFLVGEVITIVSAGSAPPQDMSTMPQTSRPTADLSALETDVAAAQAAADAAQAAADAAQADADAAATAAATAQDGVDAANEAIQLNTAKGLVFGVFKSNVSISSPTGIDEAGIEDGQTILLVGQTDATQNGAYVSGGNGVALVRANNADSADELMGAFWFDVNGDLYRVTSAVATLGSDNVVIALDTEDYEDVESDHNTAGAGGVTSITGLPADRTTFELYSAGRRLIEGASNDFTVSGNTATVASGSIAEGDTYYYVCRRPVRRT